MGFKETFSCTISKLGYGIKQKSPELLLGLSIASGLGAVFFACKETLKAKDILEEAKETIEAVHQIEENRSNSDDEEVKNEYSPDDYKAAITKTYVSTGLKLVKNYAPAIGLGTLSLISGLASHGIISKRNAALSATVATLDNAYRTYRGRVKEKFGEIADREIAYGAKAEEITKTEVNEKGKEVIKKEVVETVPYEASTGSPFSFFFDSASRYWEDNYDFNHSYLAMVRDWMFKVIDRKGYITLNEVLERMDIPTTASGTIAGWVKGVNVLIGPDGVNDICFGANETLAKDGDFSEPVILIDFAPQILADIRPNVWKKKGNK